ncbi:MAG: hypothetical protein LBC75_04960 [Fibromonadaceae bacterium]|jgi:hypothetical protein|nr:hypothetical protein [Fibromonadaceae bacterium]
MTEDIYNDMLEKFPSTFEKTSLDREKSEYMTSCQKEVVYFDQFKVDFMKTLLITDEKGFCKSCDAIYMTTSQKEFFMIEFKNGDFKNNDIKIKILESLLLLSRKFPKTNFMEGNMYFILVYNEDVRKQEQPKNTDVKNVSKHLFSSAKEREIRFGLNRFKKLYFKDVFTYSKTEFVSKYCV